MSKRSLEEIAVDGNIAVQSSKKRSKGGDEDKAARKARKEAKRALEATSEPENTDPVQEPNDDAARKAAKKAKKEAKKAAKTDATISSNDATTTLATQTNGHVAKATSVLGYSEHSDLSALPEFELDDYISKNHISTIDPKSDSAKLRPIIDFKYLPITDEAHRKPLAAYSTPTPIQAAAWPYLFAQRDVVGVAETGSGKTVAFGLPCIRAISSLPARDRANKIKACIVSPTRELALQIYEQLEKLATPSGLKVGCAYGGVPKDEQRRSLAGVHIIVATPGRLNDFVDEGSIDLSAATYLVLDEADRMLDTGFEKAVKQIASATSQVNRQTLMFTATWPPAVEELASTFMTTPIRINIGENTSGELRANMRITQQVEVMDPYDKNNRILEILKQHQSGAKKNDKILVFCLYKKEASRIESFIRTRGFKVAGIHGDMTQQARSASLDAFKTGAVPLLVATDVAARGLDIPAVKVVLNVTFPLTIADYVHRIGRTGRAGQTGLAITFFTDHEKALAGSLQNVLKAAGQPVPEALSKFGNTVKKKEHDAYGAFYKDPATMKKATKITFD